VKVTREKAAQNRASLVRAAGRLIRQRGIDGVGVAEISDAAGLTQGALYAQFPSKGALAAEALADGLDAKYEHLISYIGGVPRLGRILDFLINTQHRDDFAGGCPLTASASEGGRQDKIVSDRFAFGFERLVRTVQESLVNVPASERRARALTIISAQIGAIAVARATAKARPKLSDEVIGSARRVLGTLDGGRRK
jgi:TetR/AcrR family transcriptional repressor of nem operon